jgi:hypothetical protein
MEAGRQRERPKKISKGQRKILTVTNGLFQTHFWPCPLHLLCKPGPTILRPCQCGNRTETSTQNAFEAPEWRLDASDCGPTATALGGRAAATPAETPPTAVTYIARSLMKLQLYKLQKKREKKQKTHTQSVAQFLADLTLALAQFDVDTGASERARLQQRRGCASTTTNKEKKHNLSRSVMYSQMYPSMLYIRILYTNICTSTLRVKVIIDSLKTSREHFAECKSQCWVGIWFFWKYQSVPPVTWVFFLTWKTLAGGRGLENLHIKKTDKFGCFRKI